jgi:predicted SAM-dependent methyltransferase
MARKVIAGTGTPAKDANGAALDLARRKWIDPGSAARFVRQEPRLAEAQGIEDVLHSVGRLNAEIFEHLSVFEQFPETTSRGARGAAGKKTDARKQRARLLKVERELWEVYRALRGRRAAFVRRQLRALRIDEQSKGLKIHIGCGGRLLRDWVNVDAGGANLALNVNWGLPFPDGSVRFAYSAHLLEHLRYVDQAPVFVRDVHRVLAKGGTVRFAVPDIRKLLVAYADKDRKFFEARRAFYPLKDGFVDEGLATLDYILLFCGAGPQSLNFNHKFGYDFITLRRLLVGAGFEKVIESSFQKSRHRQLRVDDVSYNARAGAQHGHNFSMFVEATKQ